MKKKVSKSDTSKDLPPEMKRYLGALNEMHSENLKAINENFILVNRKLDYHSVVLNSHTEMIGELKQEVTLLKEDVSEI